MTQRIVIDPVTRIEGHAKISIFLDESGRVSDARFHVTEFRGFERFCVGRPFFEMPGITARVCGICPISHVLTSAKAGDQILGVAPPPAAIQLRKLANLAQIIQSHALSFFHLSGPDLLFGWDSDPAQRNLFGLMAAEPEFARGGIRLRQFGQDVLEALGGKKIHPSWGVPGGVRTPLSAASRDAIRVRLPEARQTALAGIERLKQLLDRHANEARTFGQFPSLFLGLVQPDGRWEHHEGRLRIVDSAGTMVVDQFDPARFAEIIGESVEPDSYLKSPYYKPLGYPAGMYRVGPLARLNVCSHFGTPNADRELTEYRHRAGRVASSSFYYHYARIVEILAAAELMDSLLDDPEIVSADCRAQAGVNRREGVGCSEAPRGTLFHHYQVDGQGLLTRVNLVIATGQNNLAMNQTVAQIAREYIRGPQIPETVLNRVEAGIRAFDPCLSCSTHALGQMPLIVRLIGADGAILDEVRR